MSLKVEEGGVEGCEFDDILLVLFFSGRFLLFVVDRNSKHTQELYVRHSWRRADALQRTVQANFFEIQKQNFLFTVVFVNKF